MELHSIENPEVPLTHSWPPFLGESLLRSGNLHAKATDSIRRYKPQILSGFKQCLAVA